MTKKEFSHLLSSVVEQTLIELLGDPEDDMELKKDLRKRLVRQRKAVADGERGKVLGGFRKKVRDLRSGSVPCG